VRLAPQFLRALHLDLFTKPSFGLFFCEMVNFKGARIRGKRTQRGINSKIGFLGENTDMAKVQETQPSSFLNSTNLCVLCVLCG
jgi:hypothetical protein